jgi:hypothetical protein
VAGFESRDELLGEPPRCTVRQPCAWRSTAKGLALIPRGFVSTSAVACSHSHGVAPTRSSRAKSQQTILTVCWVCVCVWGGGGGQLEDGPLDEDSIAAVLYGIVSALVYLHAENKIHRDIKAANVLLSATGAVKVPPSASSAPSACFCPPRLGAR